MTTTNTSADRTAHALALTVDGLDGLADAAKICDLRQCIAYAEALIADGSALAVAPTGGWFMALALAIGRAPSALEVEAAKAGTWWIVLDRAYEADGVAGLSAWGVPDDRARSVEAELLEDRLAATPAPAVVGA